MAARRRVVGELGNAGRTVVGVAARRRVVGELGNAGRTVVGVAAPRRAGIIDVDLAPGTEGVNPEEVLATAAVCSSVAERDTAGDEATALAPGSAAATARETTTTKPPTSTREGCLLS